MTTPVPDVEALSQALANDGLRVVGQLLDASNVAFFGWAGQIPVVYKPVRGERPLWDFPTGCLAHRERASYLLDAAAGFGVVPPTALHDGPAGPGSVQAWVTDPDDLIPDDSDDDELDGDVEDDGGRDAEAEEGEDDEDEMAQYDTAESPDDADGPMFLLLPPDEVAPPWLPVFTGELPDGRPVVLAHADTAELRSVAVLDAVLNNSDRKGSHLLRDPRGHLWGIDHGVSLHESPKLRTVLWGWAGEPIAAHDLDRLGRLRDALATDPLRADLDELLTTVEIAALTARVSELLSAGRHPLPTPGWPSVPWPAL